jgi:hypothetical protein
MRLPLPRVHSWGYLPAAASQLLRARLLLVSPLPLSLSSSSLPISSGGATQAQWRRARDTCTRSTPRSALWQRRRASSTPTPPPAPPPHGGALTFGRRPPRRLLLHRPPAAQIRPRELGRALPSPRRRAAAPAAGASSVRLRPLTASIPTLRPPTLPDGEHPPPCDLR